jgi:hypothetical protein
MTPFSTIASGAVALVATHKYFEYAYPRKTVEFDNYIKWQTVKAYTLSEMATRELRNCASSNISASLKTLFPSYIDSECIILSKNGNAETYPSLSDIPREKNEMNHDLIINKRETSPDDGKHDYNMLRFKKVSDISHNLNTSSVKLLAVQLKIEGQEAIPLDFGRNNFYIDGNILFDRPFLIWFMSGKKNNATATSSVKQGSPYNIEFINHRMICDKITSDQCIIIGVDNYKVVASTVSAGE